MTREAKIGMLTGLGVILLIGVLLSDYLGGAARGMSPTGRMATLPLGAAYRQEVTEPVGVPGTMRPEGTVAEVGTVTSVAAVPAGRPTMPEVAGGSGPVVAGDMNGNGPTVGAAVSPVPAGDVRMDAPLNTGSLPTLQLADANGGEQAVYVAGQAKPASNGAQALKVDGKASDSVKGQEYVILPGDTLGKIATKFYKTSKGDVVARIVAANPAMLKNDKTMLVAGKKLMIPNAPVVAKATVAAAPAVANAKKTGSVVIHQPGTSGSKGTDGADTAKGDASASKTVTGKVYVVVSGDTFEKIAKKLGATDVNGMVKKLETVNGVKDPTSLQVGQKLKVPV